MSIVAGLMQWATRAFLPLGGWGLFLVSFADSSFSPIPPDVLLIPLVLASPEKAVWYATVATISSVLGASFAYLVGQRLGRQILLRMASERVVKAIQDTFARWGAWAVGVAGFVPIPLYKEFAIAGGLFNLGKVGFLLASTLGRGGRFFLLAILLRAYGRPIEEYVARNWLPVSLAAVLLAVAGYLAFRFLRRAKGLPKGIGRLWESGLSAAQAFADRRIRAWGEYAVYFTAGWVAFAITLAAFGKVVDEVFLERSPVAEDLIVMRWVHGLVSPALTRLMIGITTLASAPVVIALALIIIGVFLIRRWQANALAVAVLTAGDGGIVEILKHVFHRLRPTIYPHLVVETDFSFPSGHSMLAASLFGYLAYLCIRRGGGWRWAAAALVTLVGLVGLSRVYLGVHWPTDVLGGYVVGGAWLLACVLILEGFKLRMGGSDRGGAGHISRAGE